MVTVVVTESRLRYQDLRGLTRSFSVAFPSSRSQVHFTSAAVKGLPSCHLTCRMQDAASTLLVAF